MSDSDEIDGKWNCSNCDQVFTSKKRYEQHIKNTIPCDLKCDKCNMKMHSRGAYYKHFKKCKGKSEDINSMINAINNTNNSNNGSNNNTNALTNNANMVFLNPYGLEHRMMFREEKFREELLGGAKEKVLGIVRAGNFLLAYQTLFNHIHGNSERPEFHNVYLSDREKDEVCSFTGKQFAITPAEEETPGLYRYLMIELKWMVGTSDIPFSEKDQLLHNIQCHWRSVNETTDKDIRTMLFNNKPVVENTMTKNHVKPNTALLEEFYKFKRGTLKTYDLDVTLPKVL